MADIDPLSDPPSPAPGPRRSANILEPTPDRSRPARAKDKDGVDDLGVAPHRVGDVPPSLSRRYFTEALRGGAVGFYEGPGAKRRAFTDHGTRLVTDQTHPAVARDLTIIAVHRGWLGVRVSGEDAFRREVWMEARALGLEVKGYRPKERDQQELDRRLQAAVHPPGLNQTRTRAAQIDVAGPDAPTASTRPDYDKGVSGRLVDSGEAPYRRRRGEPMTPFLRIDRGDGRLLDIWGAGLPPALARSGAQKGDAIVVRRDGVDVVQRTFKVRDPKTGALDHEMREVRLNRWVVDADRFRQATPSQAARDENLRCAQSHLRILDCAIEAAVSDPQRRARLQAEARELVAQEIAEGRRFTPARIREIEPQIAHDLAATMNRRTAAERGRHR